MSAYIPAGLRRQVIARGRSMCAYCHSTERLMGVDFEIDHIIPEALGGETNLNNLCVACPACNRFKAARLTILDADTGKHVRLFHPLQDQWQEHFAWMEHGTMLRGLTPIGRVSITALKMNREGIVEVRKYWVALGLHPPTDLIAA